MKTRKKPRRADAGAKPIDLPPETRAWLSIDQIASALSMSVRHVREMVATGVYPKADVKPGDEANPNPIGRFARWKVETHNAWCDAQAKGGAA